VRAAIVALVISLLAGEGVSLIRGQRLRAEIRSIDVADLDRVREQYGRLGTWTVFGLGRWRVSADLVNQMLRLADRTIVEYRNEHRTSDSSRTPVAEAQWQQAQLALDFASSLAPSDLRVASRRTYVRGQQARIDEQLKRTRNGYRQAIRLFREAARMDQRSFDPYLGLASVFAYGTRDLEGLAGAMAEAERRGYTQGPRERLQFGDLHKTLADEQRAKAARLSGSEKVEQLEGAATGYAKCIEYFDGLRLFESEANLNTCRKRLADVQAQLPPSPAAANFSGSQL